MEEFTTVFVKNMNLLKEEMIEQKKQERDEMKDVRFAIKFLISESVRNSEENKAMWEETRQEFKNINNRLDKIDTRLDRIEERLDRVEERLDRVEERLDRVEERLDRVEERLDEVEGRLDEVEEQVYEVKEEIKQIKSEIVEVKDDARRDREGVFDVYERYERAVDKLYYENKNRIDNIEKNCSKCEDKIA